MFPKFLSGSFQFLPYSSSRICTSVVELLKPPFPLHRNRILRICIKQMSTSVEGTGVTDIKEDHSRSRCLFCRICDEKEQTRIIYKDDEIVVFPDIRPASKYHFLVCPSEHIRDSKCLTTQTHSALLERLVEVGNQVLRNSILEDKAKASENVDASQTTIATSSSESNDELKVLMGFHWPPFHTVSHLHLHVIAPSDQLGFIKRLIFRPNSFWFVSPEWVRSRLEKLQLELENRPSS